MFNLPRWSLSCFRRLGALDAVSCRDHAGPICSTQINMFQLARAFEGIWIHRPTRLLAVFSRGLRFAASPHTSSSVKANGEDVERLARQLHKLTRPMGAITQSDMASLRVSKSIGLRNPERRHYLPRDYSSLCGLFPFQLAWGLNMNLNSALLPCLYFPCVPT